MPEAIAGIVITDTDLLPDATAFVRQLGGGNIFNHARRVFLWGSLRSEGLGLDVDPELAYVGALFHDLGLTTAYRTTDRRFELDGAEAARAFLLHHGRSERDALNVWLGIALHTTPEIPHHMAPEVRVVILGVETDVLGLDLNRISDEERTAVVNAHPRPDFKNCILQAFYDGMVARPETTFGTMNDDVLAHFTPGFTRSDFVDIIRGSAWPE